MPLLNEEVKLLPKSLQRKLGKPIPGGMTGIDALYRSIELLEIVFGLYCGRKVTVLDKARLMMLIIHPKEKLYDATKRITKQVRVGGATKAQGKSTISKRSQRGGSKATGKAKAKNATKTKPKAGATKKSTKRVTRNAADRSGQTCQTIN